MHRPFRCPHCHSESHIVAPAAWTRVLLAFAWVNAAVMVLCAGMIGPFIMLVIPPLFACGAGLVSGAHALAGEPPTCGSCGKIVPVAAPVQAEVVRFSVRPARAA